MQTTGRRGLVDSLSAGFAIVTRRPLLLALPVLVDALLWLAPGISIKPLVRSATAWLTGTLASSPISPDQLANLKAQTEEMARSVEGMNLLGILGWQVPSLVGLSSQGARDSLLLTVTGGGTLALLLAGLAAASVLLACLYLGPAAQMVRQATFHPATFLRGLAPSWVRMASYLLLVVTGAIGMGAVSVLLLALSGLLGASGLVLAGGLALGVALLASVYLFLAEAAIFVGGSGPVQAIVQSVRLASRGFWSILGLFLVVQLITQGMGVIWRLLSTSGVGLVASILGNAYISTGLVASVMVYYWDRHDLAQQRRLPVA